MIGLLVAAGVLGSDGGVARSVAPTCSGHLDANAAEPGLSARGGGGLALNSAAVIVAGMIVCVRLDPDPAGDEPLIPAIVAGGFRRRRCGAQWQRDDKHVKPLRPPMPRSRWPIGDRGARLQVGRRRRMR